MNQEKTKKKFLYLDKFIIHEQHETVWRQQMEKKLNRLRNQFFLITALYGLLLMALASMR